MAAAPELAPEDQNHLLRSSSVVRNIEYRTNRITYQKFDARSTELFKMGAWAPKSVRGGAMKWDPKRRLLDAGYSPRRSIRMGLSRCFRVERIDFRLAASAVRRTLSAS
jgi:hypothetical protein